ncbi:hypothetical protein J3L18_19310 [Mucilaginibacter gossypii]|uniref:hypothetical protein n=2 Tax=Mucilaginibacter TaxID=423349 RepID=UPI00101AA34A|nr:MULTISPECIES: hypothetical protein [Mucilaginibacter]QTE35286.1 hypothetical protein J3L18_19310 [Mucilaginibacter gossypii]
MEAIALVTLHRHHYPRLQQTAFVAIGSRLHDGQASWIRQHFPKRKFTLVFGKDLLGHLTAIKMAAGIRNVPVRMFHTGHQVAIYNDERELITSDERLSLHAFQEAFGLRPRFRTACARLALTFLDQLQTSRT